MAIINIALLVLDQYGCRSNSNHIMTNGHFFQATMKSIHYYQLTRTHLGISLDGIVLIILYLGVIIYY